MISLKSFMELWESWRINTTSSRDSNIQQMLSSRGMVARTLRKVHCRIIRRLSPKPKLANPWLGEFTVDMPMEVMDCIAKFILNQIILVTNSVRQTLNCPTEFMIFEKQNISSRG